MADYHNTTQISVSPTALFEFLSEVGNLPRYFARMRSAERVGDGNTVRAGAELPDGRVVEGEAWLETDHDQLTMRWGAQGAHDYHGHLAVTGDGDGSQVQVVVSTERVESEEVQRGVDDTVANIKNLLESRSAQPAQNR